jgi:hypothetical protein
MILAYSGEWEIVEKMVKERQVNLNSINLFDSWTFLHIAAASEYLEDNAKFILDSVKNYINYQ